MTGSGQTGHKFTCPPTEVVASCRCILTFANGTKGSQDVEVRQRQRDRQRERDQRQAVSIVHLSCGRGGGVMFNTVDISSNHEAFTTCIFQNGLFGLQVEISLF